MNSTPSIPTALSPLDQRVVNRAESLFAPDLGAASAELDDLIRDSRILMIGGAGSIGSQTLRTILHFAPRTLHVIDHDENGLAELVRGLRSSPDTPPIGELLTLPFDLGGDPFRLWLSSTKVPYDHVLNFAALKHVRTEKDPFSILAMLETNVLQLDHLSELLHGCSSVRRVFSVSTDKAANPSSMMGATKRLMEHALFHPTQPWPSGTEISSARFANVAFSNGSLLQAWQRRIAAGQPIACPQDTRRFFVSLEESGHLCTLAGFLGSDRTIMVPALDPSEQLVVLSDVATAFLDHHGFEAFVTYDESEALGRVDELRAASRWPLLLTPLDTGGEKPYEEFVGEHEVVRSSRFASLQELDYVLPAEPDSFTELVATLRAMLAESDAGDMSVDTMRALIARVEPSFASTHRASTKSLDQRM